MKSTKFIVFGLFAVMLFAFAACGQMPTETPDSDIEPNTISQSELRLRETMNKLWSDHVIWTRDYIIAAVAGTPDAEAAATRLLENQVDIGNAVASYYGRPAGDQLTTLLTTHITIAVDLIEAAKTGDQTAFDELNTQWTENGDEIADFLASANPNWPAQTLKEMMAEHLETTTTEVTARLEKNYANDVAAFDEVYDHILIMADALSDGIVKQFPEKF